MINEVFTTCYNSSTFKKSMRFMRKQVVPEQTNVGGEGGMKEKLEL